MANSWALLKILERVGEIGRDLVFGIFRMYYQNVLHREQACGM